MNIQNEQEVVVDYRIEIVYETDIIGIKSNGDPKEKTTLQIQVVKYEYPPFEFDPALRKTVESIVLKEDEDIMGVAEDMAKKYEPVYINLQPVIEIADLRDITKPEDC